MERVKYGIEYAHIYTDEAFSWEHLLGVEALKEVLKKVNAQQQSYALAVLIDNYNPEHHTLDVSGFENSLTLLGAKPDYVGLEARLVDYKDDLLDMMTKPRLKRMYQRYIEQKNKVPCSFLVAVWYLGRLGLLPFHKEQAVYAKLSLRPTNFTAEHLINILPRRYREVELKALEIIEATPHYAQLQNISSIFHDATPTESYVNLF